MGLKSSLVRSFLLSSLFFDLFLGCREGARDTHWTNARKTARSWVSLSFMTSDKNPDITLSSAFSTSLAPPNFAAYCLRMSSAMRYNFINFLYCLATSSGVFICAAAASKMENNRLTPSERLLFTVLVYHPPARGRITLIGTISPTGLTALLVASAISPSDSPKIARGAPVRIGTILGKKGCTNFGKDLVTVSKTVNADSNITLIASLSLSSSPPPSASTCREDSDILLESLSKISNSGGISFGSRGRDLCSISDIIVAMQRRAEPDSSFEDCLLLGE
mmetsp:Transcript_18215/g.29021  ORF Transcript_18215/g.29021 Transcript_18215/m.29021 type:complete len:278 (-) Transcript_18215:792-1625(-)